MKGRRWVLPLCALLALGLLAVSLLPMLALIPYAGPLADDFGYGAPVYYALRAGLGPGGVLSALGENLRYTYQNWQGTYASVLLFSLQPAALGEGLYFLTPLAVLAAVIAPVFLALGAVRALGRWERLLLGSLLSLAAVQCLPQAGEALFWWNGSAHYLFFWAFGVLGLTLQLRLTRRQRRDTRYWVLLVAGCLLGLWIGGGNYSTALVFPLLAAVPPLWSLWTRRGRDVPAALPALAVPLSAAVGLLFSVLAPGNAVRQAGLLGGLGAAEAILASFRLAGAELWELIASPLLALLPLAVLLFLRFVPRDAYSFPAPFLVLFGSFCSMAALYTPPLYAMGQSDLPRLHNLFFLAGTFLLFGNAFYLAGWVRRKWGPFRAKSKPLLALTAGIAAVGLLVSLPSLSAAQALDDLRSGQAQALRQERESRQAVLGDPSANPRFRPLTAQPIFLPTSQFLTWHSDLLVDGLPSPLPCYHLCGGEVSVVPLTQAWIALGGEVPPPSPGSFSSTFSMAGETCVPLRELCARLGYQVDYRYDLDTIFITTHPQG